MVVNIPESVQRLFYNVMVHPSHYWAWDSAVKLGSLQCPDMIPILKHELHSQDEHARECCLEILAMQNEPETVDELKKVFQDGKSSLTSDVTSIQKLRATSSISLEYYQDLDRRMMDKSTRGVLEDPLTLIDAIPNIISPEGIRQHAADIIWRIYTNPNFFRNLKEGDIQSLHAIFYEDYDNLQHIRYRGHKLWSSDGVQGSITEPYGQLFVVPSSVPHVMASLVEKLKCDTDLHPLNFIGDAFYHQNIIHPFADCNGRTNFLLLNLFLLHSRLPYVKMREEELPEYYRALNRPDPTHFVKFLGRLLTRTVN